MAEFLTKYAMAAVPRYTSYPPATRFHENVDAAACDGWLRALGAGDTLSLYIHVPFCKALCWYCGCNTSVPNRDDRVARYVDALTAEIGLVAARVDPGARVVHVHFGGGTPNILTPAQFGGLMGRLRSSFTFSGDVEIDVELDPRALTDEQAAAFAAAGVTRASLGVQDVSEDVQKLINRIQPLPVVEAAVARLRDAGIARINMDLMYGLPGQTTAHVERSARAMVALEPDRFAVFGYAHVPWFKRHQRAIDEAKLPGGAERLAQAEAAAAVLTDAGYAAIGIDHFALPDDPLAVARARGRLRRNFQGYTVDPAAALIGLGASSIGAYPLGYAQNEPHVGRYEEAVAEGRLPVVRGVEVTPQDRFRRGLIERLMCDLEVDIAAVRSSVGAGTSDDLAEAGLRLQDLADDGLVERQGDIVRVTRLGRPYIRNAAACFDAYHAPSATRHSTAV